MQPTLAQRLFARKWPEFLTLLAGAVGVPAWAAPALAPAGPPSVLGIIWFVVQMGAAALLGVIVAAFFGLGILLDPLFRWRLSKNGAPFRVGDRVMILAGPHRGRIVRVYEVWPTRGQVRVELGRNERDGTTDVLSEMAVCRDPAADEPDAAADRGGA